MLPFAASSRPPSVPTAQVLTPGEQQDLSFDRKLRLLYSLLRPPAYDRLFRGPVDAVSGGLRRVPLLGTAADYVADLLNTTCAYYTYTSGSS